MSLPILNELLPDEPLLGLASVPGVGLEALADPFPISHDGTLYVLAEVLGRGNSGALSKHIGAFRIGPALNVAEYLGATWGDDEGRFSYPYTMRDGDRYLMVPEVFVPLVGADESLQVLQIWQTDADEFPFGWSRLHEAWLPGCQAPSDKVLLRRDGTWWLFCTDNAQRRVLLYRSEDLDRWSPHPMNPLVSKDGAGAAADTRLGDGSDRRAWRLGGGVLERDGALVLPLQHKHVSDSYGGAVTLLTIDELTPERLAATLDPQPVLAEDATRPWMSAGAHHVALAEHGGRVVASTDGFDGRHWTSTLIELPPALGLRPCGAGR